jgi:hypothetical protein
MKMINDPDSFVIEALWKMYSEHCTHVRHHETQRSSVASSFVAIAGALVGLITFDKEVTMHDIPAALLLLGLGVFGAFFCAKQWERACMHTERSRFYRNKIDELLPGVDIRALKQEADKSHNSNFPRLHTLRLHKFWIALYLLIALLGAALTIIASAFPMIESGTSTKHTTNFRQERRNLPNAVQRFNVKTNS